MFVSNGILGTVIGNFSPFQESHFFIYMKQTKEVNGCTLFINERNSVDFLDVQISEFW